MTSPNKPPTDTLPRVLRGGGWGSHYAAWVRAAYRITGAPGFGYYFLSFRCAQRGCRQQVLKGMTPP